MAGPPPNREPVVDHLAEVWGSTRAVCTDLQPEQWDEPSDCPGWTVRDNLAHLIGIERMLLGDQAPQPPDPYPAYVRNPLGELNEAWVAARRSTPGHEVLREFSEVTDRRLEELRSLPAARFDDETESLLGAMPYRQFLRVRVVDSWAHEQDIRRAIGRPGDRNGAGEAVVVEGCVGALAKIVGKDVAPDEGSTVLFTVSGLLGRQFAVAVSGGRGIAVDPKSGAAPTTHLSMDQEAFWLLCLGRVAPLRLLGTGQVRIDGDVGLGHRVLDAMAFVA